MPSDVLEFTSNATHMQQVCNKDIDMYRIFFSRNTGECPFLRVSTSGAADSEYIDMVLASIEIYLLDGIARQRDMSKIALQSTLIASTSSFISKWVYTFSVSVIAPECPTIFLIIVWLIPASANIEMYICSSAVYDYYLAVPSMA